MSKQSEKKEMKHSEVSSELAMLEAMSSEERKIHFATQLLEMEESTLRQMIRSIREPESDAYNKYRAMAKDCVDWYESDGDEQHLIDGEFYTEVARSLKLNRSTLKEVKEQRKRVQCQRTKLNQLTTGEKSNS